MLHHVADIDRTLAALRRAMRPNGLLMATTNGDGVRSTGRYRLLRERGDVDERARRIAEGMAGKDGAIHSPVLMGAFIARREEVP